MPTLLSPAWLLALGALLVPLALHLISRGRTRRVRVPSVRLLAGNDSRAFRRIRPTQLLLLALRCALLTLVALALAEPRWPVAAQADAPAWALVAPSLLREREAARPEVSADLERLVAGGAELRWLATGFPRLDEAPDPEAGADPEDVWSLLREADALAPVGATLEVFVQDRLVTLRGARPTFARPVRWHAVASSGRNRWIERARSGGDDAPLTVVVAESDPERTAFTRHELAVDETDQVVRRIEGELTLAANDAFAGDDRAALPSSRALDAAVFHDGAREEDAACVRAALRAAADHALIRLTLHEANPQNAQPLDLVFWLSGKSVPDTLLARVAGGGTLVSDGGELHESCSGFLEPPFAQAAASGPGVPLRRCSPPVDPADGDAATLWTDGSGRTLLGVGRTGGTTRYRFHGRFHPVWSDLPIHPAFPSWMLEVLEGARTPTRRGASSATAWSDLRGAAGQGAPRVRIDDSPASHLGAAPQRLMWVLAAALLILERAIASRSREVVP